MKKVFMMMVLLAAALSVSGQDDMYTSDDVMDDGSDHVEVANAYEKKVVVAVDSVSASVLFDRAMTALSDWAGAAGESKAGVDYQNQETHTVIYKGRYSLGAKSGILGASWLRYAEFTMKVRCKDGRVQVTVTVPSMIYQHSGRGNTVHYTYSDLAKKVAKSGKHKREKALLEDLKDSADGLVESMAESLRGDDGEDDF